MGIEHLTNAKIAHVADTVGRADEVAEQADADRETLLSELLLNDAASTRDMLAAYAKCIAAAQRRVHAARLVDQASRRLRVAMEDGDVARTLQGYGEVFDAIDNLLVRENAYVITRREVEHHRRIARGLEAIPEEE